jgi:hypothetical protein
MVNARENGYTALVGRGTKRPRSDISSSEHRCKTCAKAGHKESDCWVDMICENCQRKGHPARNCWREKAEETGDKPPRARPLHAMHAQMAITGRGTTFDFEPAFELED